MSVHSSANARMSNYNIIDTSFPSLFFECFAGTGATCVSSMETGKTMLSQRSLSLSIIQSRQNREACRAPQYRSQLGHFVFLSHFYKKKVNGKVKSRVSKRIKKFFVFVPLRTKTKQYCWYNVPRVTVKSWRSHHTGQDGQLYSLLTPLNFFFFFFKSQLVSL